MTREAVVQMLRDIMTNPGYMVEWLRWILSSTIVWNMESHLKCLSSLFNS